MKEDSSFSQHRQSPATWAPSCASAPVADPTKAMYSRNHSPSSTAPSSREHRSTAKTRCRARIGIGGSLAASPRGHSDGGLQRPSGDGRNRAPSEQRRGCYGHREPDQVHRIPPVDVTELSSCFDFLEGRQRVADRQNEKSSGRAKGKRRRSLPDGELFLPRLGFVTSSEPSWSAQATAGTGCCRIKDTRRERHQSIGRLYGRRAQERDGERSGSRAEPRKTGLTGPF